MTYSKALCQFKPFIPWVFTSIALGYAAYLHYSLKKLNESKKKTQCNPDNLDKRHELNIDTIDRNNPKKRVSYCRCWKSVTFPLCDGAHKCHNKENDDKTGPLVLVWNDDSQQISPKSIPESMSPIDQDMDIKSFDSESPILQSSSGDSNGEFEKMEKMNESAMNISDEQLSSLEMIENEYDDEVTIKESTLAKPQ